MKLGIILISLALFACGANDEVTSTPEQVIRPENSGDATQNQPTTSDLEENTSDGDEATDQESSENSNEEKITDNEVTLSVIENVTDGKDYTIKEYLEGSEFIIMAINGTQCGYCHQEMSRINASESLREEMNTDKCKFVTVVEDYNGYNGESPAHYWADTYPGYIADATHNLGDNFALPIRYFPTTYVIDREGNVMDQNSIEGAVENYCR